MIKLYAQRDIEALDDYGNGNHYFKHVSAMTGEGLHSKSDICAELGVRDAKIEYLLGLVETKIKIIAMLQGNSCSKDYIKEHLPELPEFIYVDEGGV